MVESDEDRLPETISVRGVVFEFQKFDTKGYQWIHQMTDEEIQNWMGEDISLDDSAGGQDLTYIDSDDLGFSVWGNEKNRPMLIVNLEYWKGDGFWTLSGAETIKPSDNFPRVGATEPIGQEYSENFDTFEEALPHIEKMAEKLVPRLSAP